MAQPKGEISSLAWSPDGMHLATAVSSDYTIQLWQISGWMGRVDNFWTMAYAWVKSENGPDER